MRLAALALLSAAGEVERSSKTFNPRHGGSADLVQQSHELGRVLAGETDRAVFSVDGLQAAIEAVTDAQGTRRGLLTLSVDPASTPEQDGNAVLTEPLDDSPAIIWLKDLNGRYLRVNRRYTMHVGVSEDRIQGHTDAELSARETIDGPRLQDRDPATPEPLQLEYTVPSFEGRAALSVLRFPVRDRAGAPIAVCSVAAPLESTQVANTEAARLMEMERFSRLDANAIRDEFLRAWELVGSGGGVEPSSPPSSFPPPSFSPPSFSPSSFSPSSSAPRGPPPPSATPPAPAPAYPEEIDDQLSDLTTERDSALAGRAELGRELAHAQLRLAELDTVRAQAESTRVRVEELEREVNEARALAAEAESQAQASGDRADGATAERAQALADVERARADAEQARLDAERVRADLERAWADAEQARLDAERVRADVEQARADAERARAELEALRPPRREAEAERGSPSWTTASTLTRCSRLRRPSQTSSQACAKRSRARRIQASTGMTTKTSTPPFGGCRPLSGSCQPRSGACPCGEPY